MTSDHRRLLLLFFLLGLPFPVVVLSLYLGFGVMDRTSGIGADLLDGADFAALGDNGVAGELAHLELRMLRLVFRFRLLIANRGKTLLPSCCLPYEVICTSCGLAAICLATCARP